MTVTTTRTAPATVGVTAQSDPPDPASNDAPPIEGRARARRSRSSPLAEVAQLPARQRLLRDSLLALGVFLLGLAFVVTLGGSFRQARDQQVLYNDFRLQLATSIAPVGPVDADGNLLGIGDPIAVLEAPSIGLSQVVVEGTTSSATASGPGHRRDTVLPGQPGVSVVMGRQATDGGPFAGIGSLTPGAELRTITGQGVATFRVIGVRYAGDPQPPLPATGKSRITLISATGTPYLPDGVVRVDADLVSTDIAGEVSDAAFEPSTPLASGVLGQSEQPMQGDTSQVFALVLWAQAFLLALLAFTWARLRWGRWQAWLGVLPVLVAVGLALSSQLILLLPNLM